MNRDKKNDVISLNFYSWVKTLSIINDYLKTLIILNTNMAAAFLPAILVPIVGLIFPAFSMALFFIYISIDDID